ncbi:hypothetical protein [Paenibacillus apii]|uniref:hypothetical protein n=1 Tax=Paenibacillus apii TaxID=1850370 RepID=UPI001439212C|nr:hypothetical protein [Paenibacillus apii]NJJ37793.1 hypothetical protein [Paenibacillus apii]
MKRIDADELILLKKYGFKVANQRTNYKNELYTKIRQSTVYPFNKNNNKTICR